MPDEPNGTGVQVADFAMGEKAKSTHIHIWKQQNNKFDVVTSFPKSNTNHNSASLLVPALPGGPPDNTWTNEWTLTSFLDAIIDPIEQNFSFLSSHIAFLAHAN